MKKSLFLLMFAPFSLLAQLPFGHPPNQFERTQSAIDPNLKNTDAIYEFQFISWNEVLLETEVYYSIDGSERKLQRTKNGIISIPTTAGKHIFHFYYDPQFDEIYSDSLMIEALKRDSYTVNLFRRAVVTPAKPVIYFYPQQSTEVTVKIDINGEDTFLYPAYTDSWNFTAHPNGDLDFGQETYNYLFWESTTEAILYPKETPSGFLVTGQNVIAFFEDKLTQAGLTSKEQADFITYWGPTLSKNKLNFVYFEFNETCEKYATLDISPKPDHLYRIFMVWEAVEAEFPVTEQEIQRIDRTGFSVLEWGGMEMNSRQNVSQNTN